MINEQHLLYWVFIEWHYDLKGSLLKLLLQKWKRFCPHAPALATIDNWIAKRVIEIKSKQLLRTR